MLKAKDLLHDARLGSTKGRHFMHLHIKRLCYYKKNNQEKATACASGGTYKIVIVIMLLCSIEELGGVCFFYLILNRTLMLNNVNY